MKTYEAREMTYAELVEKLEEAKDDLFNLRFQLAVSQSDNTARLGELRRDIARMRNRAQRMGAGRPPPRLRRGGI